MTSAKLLLMSLVMTQAQQSNLDKLMMKMTHGMGCAENEHFSFYSKKAYCCLDDSENDPALRLAPNVCLEGPMLGDKRTPIPRCTCNKGFDLKFVNANTIVDI